MKNVLMISIFVLLAGFVVAQEATPTFAPWKHTMSPMAKKFTAEKAQEYYGKYLKERGNAPEKAKRHLDAALRHWKELDLTPIPTPTN